MNRLFNLCVLLSAVGTAQAASFCPAPDTSASYGLHYQLAANGVNRGTLELLRKDYDTALYNPARQIGEWWRFADSNRPEFHRVFDDAQRRIDYTHGDLKALGVSVSAASVQSFAVTELLPKLTKGVAISDCPQAESYSGTIDGVSYSLIWRPDLQLPLLLETQSGEQRQQWLADRVVASSEVNTRFARWQEYRTTDFADIGDEESDPFLAKMINQGFIEHNHPTAYNSDGTVIGGDNHQGHNH